MSNPAWMSPGLFVTMTRLAHVASAMSVWFLFLKDGAESAIAHETRSDLLHDHVPNVVRTVHARMFHPQCVDTC